MPFWKKPKKKKKINYSHYTIFYKNDKQILKIEGNPLDALKFVDDKKVDWDVLKTFDFKSKNFIIDLTFEEHKKSN